MMWQGEKLISHTLVLFHGFCFFFFDTCACITLKKKPNKTKKTNNGILNDVGEN